MKNKLVTIFGGGGFLGRYVVKELANLGYRINVITRTPSLHLDLKTAGHVGQISVTYCNIHDDGQVLKAIGNSYAVINLIGLLYQKGKNSFENIHINFPKKLAQICKEKNISKFIHISAMGVDTSSSKYARSKLMAERGIVSTFPESYILRPNIMFGQEDNFFNMFARLACFSPMLPAIGGGHTKFQPVYVCDVAKSIAILVDNDKYDAGIYELYGNEIVTFKDLLKFILKTIGKKRYIAKVPFPVASFMGKCMSVLPAPMLTEDQVEALKFDCIANNSYKSLKDLGIVAAQFEHIVPKYLVRFK
ncbi:MAG: complex I NDUFA9 subunit family protein [Alphaproteobacteria bacterium]|nr:complex I NDUFA9 subunit family protein [Alphaproteobacteria bacterium]OJV12503.1 MAG: hypothetical protein BGO27_07205 [Alphaproteobacteria bacterium 33-17]